MSDTCETCAQLKKEYQAALVEHATAEGNRNVFVPNAPSGSDDAKLIGELRLAEARARRRYVEAFRRYTEHRQAEHH